MESGGGMGSTKSDGVSASGSNCCLSNGTGSLDLSGKVIVKAQLEDNIRRVPIHNEEITYDELILMMQRLFKGQLKPEDDIEIKYKDEDGDMISLSDSSDLSFAIQCCRILKLRIYLKKDLASKPCMPLNTVRSELRDLRDRVNHILDMLDQESSSAELANANVVSATQKTAEDKKDSLAKSDGVAKAPPPVPISTREFDPLQQQAAVAAATTVQKPPSTSGSSGPSPAFNTSMSQPHAPQQQQNQQVPPPPQQVRQPPAGSVTPEPIHHHQNIPPQQQQYQQQPPQQMYQQQQQMPAYPSQQQQHAPNVNVSGPGQMPPQPQSMSQAPQQPQQMNYPPNASAAPVSSGYNNYIYPQQGQQGQQQAFSPRPGAPVQTTAVIGGAITNQPQGQPQQQQGQYGPPPQQFAPPPQQQGNVAGAPPLQQFGNYAPPPTGAVGPVGYPPVPPLNAPGANPFSRHPPPGHFKSQ